MVRECKFCEFWKTEGFNRENGECHCNAPPANLGQNRACWPVTGDKEWYGAFRECEGKLAIGIDKCPV